MSLALPSAEAMKPVVPKIPAPTVFDTTSTVALTRPSWRSSPLSFVVPGSEVNTTSHSNQIAHHQAHVVLDDALACDMNAWPLWKQWTLIPESGVKILPFAPEV